MLILWGFLPFFSVLLEPANENLHTSSHRDIENDEVIDDMQSMAEIQEEKEEGGTKGEDWEEVRV